MSCVVLGFLSETQNHSNESRLTYLVETDKIPLRDADIPRNLIYDLGRGESIEQATSEAEYVNISHTTFSNHNHYQILHMWETSARLTCPQQIDSPYRTCTGNFEHPVD